jgi:glycosyltransferase involved in cell wall biosynthesis
VPDQRRISAFFPCFNDAGTIASMVMEALVVLRELVTEYEVIVVENGSTDYAWDVLDELERLYGDQGVDSLDRRRVRSVRIIRFAEALDYGGALRAGFAACRYDLIFYTDGDGQYDVRELRSLYAALKREEATGRSVDVVMGNKITAPPPLYQLGLPQPDVDRLPVQGP